MAKTLIAGNWKMNLSAEQAHQLAQAVDKSAGNYADKVDVALFPGYLSVPAVSQTTKNAAVGVQDLYFTDQGAFTGEVSATQAKEFVSLALVGHSERRQIFGETNEAIARKAAACIRNGMTAIVCVGETEHERDQGETKQVLNDQISTGLTMLTASEMEHITIAYEPVWAIGTGNNAGPEDVAEAIQTIRAAVAEMFGGNAATQVRVLYGGSVKGDTAGSYLDLDGVDGLLVGGASLNDHEFHNIIERASK